MTIIVSTNPATKATRVQIVDLDTEPERKASVDHFAPDSDLPRIVHEKVVLHCGPLRNGHGTIQVRGWPRLKVTHIVGWDFVQESGMAAMTRKMHESMGIPGHLISAGPRSGW